MTGQSPRAPFYSFPAIPGQNPWLDVLRALAILLVLLRHGERTLYPAASDTLKGPVHFMLVNGWVGVDLFLVLSGYLIGKSLIRTIGKQEALHIAPYFRARALRILPAYYFVLLLTAAGAFPLYAFSQEDLGRRLIYHLLFLQDYLPSDINVAFWSLGVEEKFYLLVPFLVFFMLKLPRRWGVLALLGGLVLVSPVVKTLQLGAMATAPDYVDFFRNFRSPFHMSLEPLLVGLAISYVRARTAFSLSPRSAGTVMAAAGLALTVWLCSSDFMAKITLVDVSAQPLGVALLFGAMVLAATFMADTKAPLETSFRVTSRLSYTLYLVHLPLLPLALAAAAFMPMTGYAFWAVFLLLAFAVSLILHFAIEKPFLVLKDTGRLPLPALLLSTQQLLKNRGRG